MYDSAPWKTEETIVGLPRLLVLFVFSRSDSPDSSDLVAVTFHLPGSSAKKNREKPGFVTRPDNKMRYLARIDQSAHDEMPRLHSVTSPSFEITGDHSNDSPTRQLGSDPLPLGDLTLWLGGRRRAAEHRPHLCRRPGVWRRRVLRCDAGPDAEHRSAGAGGPPVHRRARSVRDRLKLADRTLVLFTSDNGPVVDDGYADGAVRDLDGDRPAGPLRGGKYSLFEGGTRVPFLVRWPGRVRSGLSDALVNQVDLLASLASLTGQLPREGSAPDSFDVLPALLGDSRRGRDHSVHHSGRLALREGSWKYIPAGSGQAVVTNTATETGEAPVDQLYDLVHDLGETTNLAAQHPERIKAMAARLQSIREARRSRP